MAAYLRPTSIDAALQALASRPLTVLAGGTDFYPARVGRPLDDDVLDITAIAGLRGIADAPGHWRIGATTTWSDLVNSDLPPPFDGLKRAAREVGGAQIQNAGTIAGNLCNASPAADGVPPLLSLDASVELASMAGVVAVPLAEFILGNRRTRRSPIELVTAIRVPKPRSPRAVGHFIKLGARRYLVISIAMVAVAIECDEAGRVTRAGVAVGACSEVARRLPDLEAALLGCPADATLADRVTPRYLAALAPIDDVRASADYRADAALTVVRRALDEIGSMVSS
ncbi:MAG: FAD binding domain-containing protein [Alphaproteobacteria bacterium]|nr:FAD binding domain-containing protein [Alphaproteobacteria bacterium]MCW5741038.1 FAD binding domain-containing protein [Alphaproteobacteria bacterium]